VNAVALVLRYVAAVMLAAMVGSACFALFGFLEAVWDEDPRILSATSTLYLVFVYSFILSLPVIAVALPLFGAAVNRWGPIDLKRRKVVALTIGAMGGILLSYVLMPIIIQGSNSWIVPVVGLIWGLASATAGVTFVPISSRPEALDG
jgi:hypothetical protein